MRKTGDQGLTVGRLGQMEALESEREHFFDNPLVRIHFIIEMILVDRPCAIEV